MQELDDEYCEVLEAVRIDCNRHGLNAGLRPQLDLDTLKIQRMSRGIFNSFLGNRHRLSFVSSSFDLYNFLIRE